MHFVSSIDRPPRNQESGLSESLVCLSVPRAALYVTARICRFYPCIGLELEYSTTPVWERRGNRALLVSAIFDLVLKRSTTGSAITFCLSVSIHPPPTLPLLFVGLPTLSEQVMKERLLFAAFNCSAIDGDDNFAGMNAAALGWDWDEDEEGEDGAQQA